MGGCSDIETIVSVPPIALNYEAVMSRQVGLQMSIESRYRGIYSKPFILGYGIVSTKSPHLSFSCT